MPMFRNESLIMEKIDLSKFIGKDVREAISLADKFYEKDLEGKINAHYIYNSLLDVVPNTHLYPNTKIRGTVRQKIWDIEKFFNWNQIYFSQSGQDKCLKNYFFRNFRNGFFVEIGAYDGVIGSNCYFFEKNMNWKGIAIEPSPIYFGKLKNNRNCKCYNKAISNITGVKEFIEVQAGCTQMGGLNSEEYKNTLKIFKKDSRTKINKIHVETSTFQEIVKENKFIDYLSIDVEGEETRIIESINFNYFEIKVLSIENNYPEEKSFYNFLKEKGFIYFDNFGVDEIYYNKKYFNNKSF